MVFERVFRLAGGYELPKTRISISGNLQCLSGKPWAATTQVK